jgi:hypothetical protein
MNFEQNSCDFSVKGTFLNMLSIGASTYDCIGEEVDNSLDAGATRIRISICSPDTKELIIADNGIGMNKIILKHAYKLNDRSNATNEQQGTFGFGNNLSKAHLTQLESSVYTVTKMRDMPKPAQIEFDGPFIISSDSYQLAPINCDTNSENDLLYRTYVETAFGSQSGTLHKIPCANEPFYEILNGIESKNVIDSLVYRFGVKYCDYITNGVAIEFAIADKIYTVDAIDPLAINKVDECHKRTSTVELYKDPSTQEILANIKGRGYLVPGKGKKITLNPDPLPPTYEKFTEFTFESSYSNDWASRQSELFEDGKFTPVEFVNLKGKTQKRQKEVESMGGRFYNRNLKNIDRVSIHQPTSGDKARYQFVEKSRHRLRFPVQMDKLMGIQVNKSALKEELIHPVIKQVRDFLEKDFADYLYDEFKKTIHGDDELKITKQDALRLIDQLIEHFNSAPESINVDSLITVLLETIGKRTANEILRFQWRIVATSVNGMSILFDALRQTFDANKEDESNVQGTRALITLIEEVGL